MHKDRRFQVEAVRRSVPIHFDTHGVVPVPGDRGFPHLMEGVTTERHPKTMTCNASLFHLHSEITYFALVFWPSQVMG
jgi:hypothetical protein